MRGEGDFTNSTGYVALQKMGTRADQGCTTQSSRYSLLDFDKYISVRDSLAVSYSQHATTLQSNQTGSWDPADSSCSQSQVSSKQARNPFVYYYRTHFRHLRRSTPISAPPATSLKITAAKAAACCCCCCVGRDSGSWLWEKV